MFDTNKITMTETIIKLPRPIKPDKKPSKRKTTPDNSRSSLPFDEVLLLNAMRANVAQRSHNYNQGTLVDETNVDSDSNSAGVEFILGSGSVKSKKSKIYLEASGSGSQIKRRRLGKRRSTTNTTDSLQQEEIDQIILNISGNNAEETLGNEPLKLEKINSDEDEAIKVKKLQKLKEKWVDPKENYSEVLPSTSRAADKKRNEYELAEYLMVDLDYRAKNLGAFKSEKKLTHITGTNLDDSNMIATSLSLNKSKLSLIRTRVETFMS